MLLTYLTVAFRNLHRNIVFSSINVAGLCIGMTVFLLITQYVVFEKEYNTFHENLPGLYRVLNQNEAGEFSNYSAPGFAPLARGRISGMEQYCRTAEGANLGTGVVTYTNESGLAEKSFRENNFVYADGNFFGFFSFVVKDGNAVSLSKPNVVALSNTAKLRYFGQESAIGKTIALNNQFGKTLYTVEIIYEDMPEFSDLRYDLIFSIQTLTNPANLNGNEMWASMEGTGSQWLVTYLKLEKSTDAVRVEKEFTKLVKSINPDDKGFTKLQAVADMHLGKTLNETMPTYGSLKFIYMLGGVATLILLIAWFKYINLSTASALKRAKEVGIRKVVGASKGQLIKQFLGESALLNTIAFILSMVIVSTLQLPYSNLVGKQLTLDNFNNPSFWALAAGVILFGTIGSGAYTAFVLSSFNPSKVLKGSFSKSISGALVRKSLVVFQFSISTMLIIGTIVLFQQWRYMENKDLGMKAIQLLVVRGPEVNKDETFKERSIAFESQLQSASFVNEFCRSGNVPTEGFNFSTSGITRLNPLPGDEKISYDILEIDNYYFDVYGITLAAGENFTAQMCDRNWNDREHLILNERAASAMGFSTPQEAVGQKVKWGERQFTIHGVVKDYHHMSVQYAIGPIVFLPSRSTSYFSMQLPAGNFSQYLSELQQFYSRSFPGNPFEYQFLDDSFAAKYHTERQYSIIFTIASCLAIFIGCLGLFGLAAYSVEQRTKEIGIRKVLGSSVFQIVRLFSKEFISLVLIAFVIAIPISWWAVDQWLQGFAYRVHINIAVYAVAALVTLLIAFATVGMQAFRGAVSNPVSSLRNE